MILSHQFYDSITIRLRYQSFGIRLEVEPQVGTPIRRKFELAKLKFLKHFMTFIKICNFLSTRFRLVAILHLILISSHYPPASKASREAANLTGRKNPHTPVHGVKEFVCLFVCDKLWPQLSQDWLNRKFWIKKLPRLRPFAGGNKICHTIFTSI